MAVYWLPKVCGYSRREILLAEIFRRWKRPTGINSDFFRMRDIQDHARECLAQHGGIAGVMQGKISEH